MEEIIVAGWSTLKGIVIEEIQQKHEEGFHVHGFKEKAEQMEKESELQVLYEQLAELPMRDDFFYIEPSELEEIRRERPEGPRRLQDSLTSDQWKDKFYGAWLGRCIGCALGKPLESGGFVNGGHGNPGWKNVKLWFEGADAWPINDYTPGFSTAAEQYGLSLSPFCKKSEKEQIRFMESDDDIRYTVLGLIMMEEKGLEWDSWDIGKMWHGHLTYGQVATAETQAYLNFAHVTSHMTGDRPNDWQQKKQWVRTHLNPYREWIGAQIRADGWAYAAAGNPELAAELGWRDASFSHVKNGIYGEMFISAMIAAAFAEQDANRIVEIGLSEIPQNSRLAQAVKEAVRIARTSSTQEELVERIWDAFKHYSWVHTINNAALVAASIIFAGDDFSLAISTAVLGGWDTDCNGATVGSIMGAKLGADRIPSHWIAPLNDTLYAEVKGFHPIAISECAERSYKVFRKLRGQNF
ncbi:ADP-ribosylglycohydrolase family protein [Cohnella sp. REN36]|nr:ADP-ribosylglycohydrolase family protein [Cohnella sp. REN36]MCC3372396.1 ADP-ribosylglycohydrolase family protein [Cohnella sp. REN36]